jgi:hypothetical protein
MKAQVASSTAGRNSTGAVACINKAHERAWVAVISLIQCGSPRYHLAVLTVFMHARDRGVPASEVGSTYTRKERCPAGFLCDTQHVRLVWGIVLVRHYILRPKGYFYFPGRSESLPQADSGRSLPIVYLKMTSQQMQHDIAGLIVRTFLYWKCS